MSRSTTIIYDTRPRWLPRRWVIVAALAVGTLAGAIWASHEPRRSEPSARSAVQRSVAAGPSVPAAASPAPLATGLPTLPAEAATVPAPPVSTMVAPGMHVTPLSVPAGTLPVPAGPRPQDTEPEN